MFLTKTTQKDRKVAMKPKPHHSKTEKYFVEYPVRALRFILNKLKIKELFFKSVRDPRSRVDLYDLPTLLMQGLFTHLFRSPSKNEFRLSLFRPSASKALAQFSGSTAMHSPCTRTLDDVLLRLNPTDFFSILPAIFRRLCRWKVFQLHPELTPQGEYEIAIDAQVTHIYHESSQHPCQSCPYCLKRTRGDKVWYVHLDVIASFVAPNGLQIPLVLHRVQARPEWGQLDANKWKQECERTAFPFLLRELRKHFPRLKLCVHLDSLYATDSIISLLEELKMGYSIVRKATVLKTVGEDCAGLKLLSKPLNAFAENKRFKFQQTMYFFNEIAYKNHKLNILQFQENAEKKPSKRFAKLQQKQTKWEWIVSQHLNSSNAQKSAGKSRIRWKQEDLFNELQHRGYSICHDFNRSPTAQTIRIFLILIAYAICSILTHTRFGQAILSNGMMTIVFMMKQMLKDLTYVSEKVLFKWSDAGQLRWGTDPPR